MPEGVGLGPGARRVLTPRGVGPRCPPCEEVGWGGACKGTDVSSGLRIMRTRHQGLIKRLSSFRISWARTSWNSATLRTRAICVRASSRYGRCPPATGMDPGCAWMWPASSVPPCAGRGVGRCLRCRSGPAGVEVRGGGGRRNGPLGRGQRGRGLTGSGPACMASCLSLTPGLSSGCAGLAARPGPRPPYPSVPASECSLIRASCQESPPHTAPPRLLDLP